MVNAIEWLKQIPGRNQDRPFLIDARNGETWSYADYHRYGCRVGAFLRGSGLERGERVALMLNNSLPFAALYLGCLYGRLVAVPVNPVLGKNDADFIIRSSGAKALFVGQDTAAQLDLGAYTKAGMRIFQVDENKESAGRGVERVRLADLPDDPSFVPLRDAQPDDTLCIVYTSGTTSQPKGVVHRICSLVDNARLFAAETRVDRDARFYGVLSMTYLGGYYNLLLLPYVCEASVVLAGAFDARSALRFWEPCRAHGVNTLWLVPTILSILLETDRGSEGEQFCRECVKRAFIGTAPLPVSLRRRFSERYGIELYENYGLSELLFVSANSPARRVQDGCVGKVLPGVQVRILDEAGQDVDFGSEGEIAVRSPHTMAGYFDARAQQPSTGQGDEWFPTGDVGILHPNGDLFITGRKKDLIIRGGINISPASIEDVIQAHASVLECAVVGVPHPLFGEEIAAVIRTRPEADFQRVKTECSDKCGELLGRIRQPSRFLEIDEFPKSTTGKIQKAKVREFLLRKLGLEEASSKPRVPAPAGASRRVVDLSYVIHEGMTTFPVHWHPMVEITVLGRHGIEDRETRKLVLGTHTGTHCDAPRHFVPGGATIDQIPVEVFVGPARVVDLSDIGPRQEVGWETMKTRLAGEVPARLVLRFDWSDQWGKLRYYQDHPYISEETALRLADGGLRLLAMDTPMPDNPANGRGTANDSPIHKILLGRGIILVEYLCNLRALTRPDIELVVLPLSIRDGDGAPARCVALEG